MGCVRGICSQLSRREGGIRDHREDWTGAKSGADAPREPGLPHSLYLVLTLVPEGLCGQVIDGQGPIQVANSCQGHPGQKRASRWLVEGPALGALCPSWSPSPASSPKPPAPVSRLRPRSHSHTAEAQGLHGVGLTLLPFSQAWLRGHSLGSENAHHL